MSSNIRAKSIEGHITDSAGNVLRNSKIVIKQSTPGGSFVVDTINSDDSGYFISRPIPGGVYDIYESGIRVSRTIHSTDNNSIQTFKANRDNYDVAGVRNFESLATLRELNDFKTYIQIEPAEIDIPQYGNTFPIYDFVFSTSENPALSGSELDLWNLSNFFNLNTNSRITTTRFDIEYYNPLTALSSSYQRIRWAGVPAIRFYKDSKLVVPLDYYSMVLNNPRVISPADGLYSGGNIVTSYDGVKVMSVNNVGDNDNFLILLGKVKKGDVLKVDIEKTGEDPGSWYGIVASIDQSGGEIILEKLLSSNYQATITPDDSTDYLATRILSYDGLFRGISEVNEDVNEKFSVVENVYAQSINQELYNYNTQA